MEVDQSDTIKIKDEKIFQLELLVNQLQLQIKMIEENNKTEIRSVDSKVPVENISNKGPIPDHLTPVQDQHLNDLHGLRMKADGHPGGDCLSSCTTMHISYTKDNAERNRVNRKIHNHIADNYDTFYINKIPLPYCETVGVGSTARRVTCRTREELLMFLRSEDSLCTYSNYQEILAISNMLNTKIHVFTYGIGGNDQNWSWNTVSPDPDMAPYSEFRPGTVPEMYLYNSDSTHFDLLVENNSRLSVLGFISIREESEVRVKETEASQGVRESQESGESIEDNVAVEAVKTVGDHKYEEYNDNDDKSHCEEIREDKESRTRESNGAWSQAGGRGSMFQCTYCGYTINTKSQIEKHIREHEEETDDGTFTCDNCSFQTISRDQLVKHIKAAHKTNIQQNKDSLKCTQCYAELKSKSDLESHIKESHKYYKPCDYFIEDNCELDSKCRFYHIKLNQGEQICYKCGKIFKSKKDLINHIKEKHGNEICHRYLHNECNKRNCFIAIISKRHIKK